MFEKYEAMKKALSQGWVPEYEGTASGEPFGVKILSDSSHRCIIFYNFQSISKYHRYHYSLIYGRKKLNIFDRFILSILMKYK